MPGNVFSELLARASNFTAAADDLRRQQRERGGDGTLRDTRVSLADDDNQTVMLYANWGDDAATVYSSFMLAEPVAAENFDANFYGELLESATVKA